MPAPELVQPQVCCMEAHVGTGWYVYLQYDAFKLKEVTCKVQEGTCKVQCDTYQGTGITRKVQDDVPCPAHPISNCCCVRGAG